MEVHKKSIGTRKIAGLKTMLTACLEFLEDPALTEPISFTSYSHRTLEFVGYCRGYLVQKKQWLRILQKLDLTEVKSVCELCPGIANKAIWALAETEFLGQAFAWDLSKNAVEGCQVLNDLFCLPFPVHMINSDLFTAKKDQFDLLLANHIIDDLLLDYLSKRLENKKEKQIDDNEEFFARRIACATQQLESQPELCHQFTEDLSKVLVRLIKKNGSLVLLEYPPLYYRSHALAAWVKVYERAVKSLYEALDRQNLQRKKIFNAFVFTKT